ncbi:MAG: MobF family relaxase [Microbacteriaceae bacterium]
MGAGGGYKYLLRTVASSDGERALSTPLTRYYAEQGTPPGRWMGSGLAALGHGEIRDGDQVSEAQLQLLLGGGLDPVTGDPLGKAYPVFPNVEDRIGARLARLDSALGVAERAAAVALIEAEESARTSRRAVAGYDFTFSLPKSASVLWGVADASTQARIAEAHHAAVAEVVAFMERELASTRSGATSRDGAVAQVEVTGLIASAFDHFDSRAADPQLHTHVVVSNKVRTVFDGKWRSLDGRPLHAATVALSELHTAVFADHLTRALGVGWERRDRGVDRNPVWAVATVPEGLVAEFSSRSRHIDIEKARLIAKYEATHGHSPSRETIIRLRQQATLATRPDKEVRTLADLTQEWRTRATRVLGDNATSWAREAVAMQPTKLLLAEDVPLEQVARLGAMVVAAVAEKRATWGRWNLYAEAARQTMGWRFAATEDREAVTGMIADAAEHASIRLTPPELASSPVAFQRADATSVFRPRNSARYSEAAVLAAEDRLLAHSREQVAPSLADATLAHALQPHRGRTLGDDQRAALRAVASSGRVLDLLVGPAGTGKTTALRALRRAWEAEHGQGSVVGLAPSAVAAEVLAEDLGIPTENTAKWWQTYRDHGTGFVAGQLVIVDEASLAGTLALDRLVRIAADAGAKVLLVGDPAQLQSVDAGGAFGMLVADRTDVPELTDVRRIAARWEKDATLDLRDGRIEAIDAYQAHDRIHAGEAERMADAAYAAWQRDRDSGLASILIAESSAMVTTLNQRARADLILAGVIDARTEVRLHDGTDASVGDTVITRRNDRELRAGRGWVRNGSRWTVAAIGGDGSLRVRPTGRRWGATLRLPAEYVAEHVELGYAVTAYRAQGVTVDTGHALVEPGATRENFYVAMTRGKIGNVAYVSINRPDDDHIHPPTQDTLAAAARKVLAGVLQHIGAELSAHQTIAVEQETWGSVAQLAAEYETIAAAAQQPRWEALLRRTRLTEADASAAIDSTAFGALGAGLRRAEADGYDAERLLIALVASRPVDDAGDVAAVLHERVLRALDRANGAGRVRQPATPIAGLIIPATGPMDDGMHAALRERGALVEQRADALAAEAIASSEAWVAELGTAPTDPQIAALWRREARTVAAFRDKYGISETNALGTLSDDVRQRDDAARARGAVLRAQHLAARPAEPESRARVSRITTPRL